MMATSSSTALRIATPVHNPSGVLSWTSRIPSPSSSRAHSPAVWQTVACDRPIAGSPLYPHHSSVKTLAIGQVARITTPRSVSPSVCSATVSRTFPPSRPTTPQTGGRAFSQVPCPRALLPRRRGGSSGSVCGTPFFPRILVRLVRLHGPVVQRHPVPVVEGQAPEPVSQPQQLRPIAAQLAGQLGGGHALGEPAEDQDPLPGPPLGAVQGRPGEDVEDAAAMAAAEVEDRVAAAAVDGHAIRGVAARAGEAVGVQPADEAVIAGLLIHQVGDREVHGCLRTGTMGVWGSTKYRRSAAGVKYPQTPPGPKEPPIFGPFACSTSAARPRHQFAR